MIFNATVKGYCGGRDYTNVEDFVNTLTNFISTAEEGSKIEFTISNIQPNKIKPQENKVKKVVKPKIEKIVSDKTSSDIPERYMEVYNTMDSKTWKSVKDILKVTSLSKRTVSYHLKYLIDSNLIEKKGPTYKHY